MKNFFPLFSAAAVLIAACNSSSHTPTPEAIASINLKKGDAVFCGPEGSNFGAVDFAVSGSDAVKKEFNQAVAMLHSFEYEESEKAFARIIGKDPSFAMAYWGVAMSNYHPLWEPPSQAELQKGAKAIEIAQSISDKTEAEAAYINAMGAFYKDWDKTDHKTRSAAYEKAMEGLYNKYPSDNEAGIFYALALNSTIDKTDKSYSKQKKAGDILTKIHSRKADHPGMIHYIIHNYDYPAIAETALPAARKYASLAPASAHAQHMPSHIFTRLGLWDESISSNLASVSSAQCYAQGARMDGRYDEELHGMDYLMYAYLQKGSNEQAKKQWDNLRAIEKVSAQNFKVAYAYATIPSRYTLENRQWAEAAKLEFYPANLPWEKFPWQRSIIHNARLLGMVHTNDLAGAAKELDKLKAIHADLVSKKEDYKASQVKVQLVSGEAWIAFKKGDRARAIELMTQAADLEDATAKHPVTPGEVLPARELLGDMYMALQQPAKALEAYEADLRDRPGRFNALHGAGLAAEKAGDVQKATVYYTKLSELADAKAQRPEMATAQRFLEGAHVKL